MSEPAVLRANERYKAVANALWTLGTALFAAGVVRGYQDRAVSIEILGWFFTASVLIWLGWKVLGLLETEN